MTVHLPAHLQLFWGQKLSFCEKVQVDNWLIFKIFNFFIIRDKAVIYRSHMDTYDYIILTSIDTIISDDLGILGGKLFFFCDRT